MLTQARLAQYQEEGYCTVPDFFSQHEVMALQAEVRRLRAEGQLRNVAVSGQGETPSAASVNLQICPILDKSPLILGLPFVEKVIRAMQQLLADPIVFKLDQIFLKPAFHGSGTSWHQDKAYFKLSDPTAGAGMWIAFHAANAANGTMRIIPKKFQQALPHSRDPLSNHHIRCFPDELQAITIELPAGGV